MSVTDDARTEAAPALEPEPPVRRTRPRYLTYLLSVLVVAALVFTVVGFESVRLNPYIYDDATITAAGQALANGQNLANYDPNINLRALRQAQINAMAKAPDVVFFGGSRWQEARSELVPGGHTIFNAYVSNDQVEDMLALTYILDKAGRLPKTMVFSLRFASLEPLSQRDTYDWKIWAPEYAAMSERVGVTPHAYTARLPIPQWVGMFNLPALYGRVQQVNNAPAKPTFTTASQTDSLDIIASDGSLHWSRKSEAKFTPAFVAKGVDTEIVSNGMKQPGIDPSLVDLMGKLIDWLRGKGVRVMIIQTPYHPDYWARIQSYPYANSLHALEATARQLAATHDAFAGGHYDPAGYPHCVPANYVDHIHPRPPCLADMFQQLPDLVTGAAR
jgi:hypothetical protein